MGTTSDKLTYLNDTKLQLKDMINYGLDTGEKITSETTFRNYVRSLFDAFIKTMTYPDVLYDNLPKVTGMGTSVTLNGTAEAPMRNILSPSAISQEGEPSPSNPQNIHTVSGDNTVVVENKNLAKSDWASDFVTAVNDNTRAKLETKDDRNCLWYIQQAGYGDYEHKNLSLGTTFKENTQYTISYDILKESANGRTVAIHYTDGTSTTNTSVSSLNTWEHQSITSVAGKTIDYIQPYYTSGFTYIDINTWQIEEGTTATSYAEHQEQSLPLNLGVKNLWNTADLKTGYVPSTGAYPTTNSSYPNAKYLTIYLYKGQSVTIDNVTDTSAKGRLRYINKDTNQVVATVTTVTNDYITSNSDESSGFKSATITAKKDVIIAFMTLNSEDTSVALDVTYGTSLQTISDNPLEYCKIGNYEDEFYKATESDTGLTAGKWYLKKNVGKVVFDGTENITVSTSTSVRTTYQFNPPNILVYPSSSKIPDLKTTKFIPVSQSTSWVEGQITRSTTLSRSVLFVLSPTSTVEQLKEIINGEPLYYVLATPTYTLLNETLQTQLENTYKAMSYDGQTNVSQENNDLPFVIKMSAIRDLSGIFEEI